MSTTDLHAIEERDFGRGPILWDASPDVCCAAYQLGACIHTEAGNDQYDDEPGPDAIDRWAAAGSPAGRLPSAFLDTLAPDVPDADEPF